MAKLALFFFHIKSGYFWATNLQEEHIIYLLLIITARPDRNLLNSNLIYLSAFSFGPFLPVTFEIYNQIILIVNTY